ncbi:ArsR/SmtB family transcription factor [Spirosoma sp.]|uniref:ArsR/SmtB family transcription factor n=1 Tax=Spirosoma sp. TaxID=1899569 RepID=UPI003B3AA28F
MSTIRFNADSYRVASGLIECLAHPVRIEILLILHAEGLLNSTQLLRKCSFGASSLYYHLDKLKSSQFIKTVRIRQDVYYQLANPQVGRALVKLST